MENTATILDFHTLFALNTINDETSKYYLVTNVEIAPVKAKYSLPTSIGS
jgi:hypothetical protein